MDNFEFDELERTLSERLGDVQVVLEKNYYDEEQLDWRDLRCFISTVNEARQLLKEIEKEVK